MAGEWIKMETSLPDKPEVLRIARRLGIDKDSVVGKLVRVWGWFDTNSVDGVVDGVVDEDIDAIAYQDGFAAALVSVGWLDVDVERERVKAPNFDRHNGESAKKRALKTERQARWRRSVEEKDERLPTATSTTASTTASTREEKRREEEIQRPARKRAAAARLVSVSELVADGVDQQAAEDWLTNRKAKDLPLTPTAWQQTKAEASKAGLTPAQAVSVAAGNGWAGFKATWAADSAKPRAGQPPVSDKFAGAL